jgi:hypothetical protein
VDAALDVVGYVDLVAVVRQDFFFHGVGIRFLFVSSIKYAYSV